jgi:hypothetical protein
MDNDERPPENIVVVADEPTGANGSASDTTTSNASHLTGKYPTFIVILLGMVNTHQRR